MHCDIVDIGTEGIADWVTIAGCLRHLAKVLLFVANVMFGTRDDASALYTSDGLGDLDTSQSWVRTDTTCEQRFSLYITNC